jgi:LysM repeat protein
MLTRRNLLLGAASTTAAVILRPSSASAATLGQIAVDAARTQIGVPYVFGKQLPGVAFDCSGLVAWAWAQAGVRMDGFTETIAATFREVAASDLVIGDLILNASLGHVVMFTGNGRCIEAKNSKTLVKEGPMTIATALCVRPTLAPVRTTPSGTAAGREIYTATARDTVYSVSVARKTPLLALARMNSLSPSSILWAGDRLVVPLPVPQTVKPPSTPMPTPSTPSTPPTPAAPSTPSTPKAPPPQHGTPTPPTAPAPTPVPAPARTYVVKSGDNLTTIAVKNATTVDRLTQLNGIANANLIQIGQVLKLA